MAGDDRTDVVVIGAGAAGAAVTWMLARAGVDVVCLEQGDWVDPRAFRTGEPTGSSTVTPTGAPSPTCAGFPRTIRSTMRARRSRR